MNSQQKRDYWHMLMGLILGMLIGVLSVFIPVDGRATDCAALDREYTAYRHCLQSAGKMRCKMTPTDFLRYYEVQYALENCHGPTTD
jgi:hypothetical protein